MGGVYLDPQHGGLHLALELLRGLPGDDEYDLSPGKKGDLRLHILGGHPSLMEDNVNFVFVPWA